MTLNIPTFVNFLISAGIINAQSARSAGTSAGLTFFQNIGFDSTTAQQLTAQVMSAGSNATLVTARPGGSAPATTSAGTQAAPVMTAPTGYPPTTPAARAS